MFGVEDETMGLVDGMEGLVAARVVGDEGSFCGVAQRGGVGKGRL